MSEKFFEAFSATLDYVAEVWGLKKWFVLWLVVALSNRTGKSPGVHLAEIANITLFPESYQP